MRSIRCKFLVVVGLMVTTEAVGQEQGAPALEALTLAGALEVARENNPTYRIAAAELETLPALERGLWVSYLPIPNSVSFSTSYSQSRTFTAFDEFGRPVRLDDAAVGTRSSSGQSIGWGVTLFDGGARLAEARGDRARAAGIRASVETADLELRGRLATRYYAVVAARNEIALNERRLSSAADIYDGTDRLFRAGMKDPLDLLGAELQVAEREQALERARGAARTAELALGDEMGVGREVTEELADGLPEPFDPSTLDIDALVRAALDGSPVISRLEASATATRHGVTAARGARWPQVSLNLNAGRGASAAGSEALFEVNPLNQNYGASLSFSIPLFTQLSTSDAITQARVARLSADESLRAGRLQLESRIRGAAIELQNAYRDIQLAERTADLAEQRLELATERYELGGSSFEELRTVSDEAYSLEYAVLVARHTFVTAMLALEEAAGVEIR